MWSLVSRVAVFLYMQIRPAIKWVLRNLTRLCELQRICYGTERGCQRTRELEWSLQMSRTSAVRTIYDRLMQLADNGRFSKELSGSAVEYAVIGVAYVKKINTQVHREFVRSFRTSLLQMCGYRQLVYDVECLRKTQFVAQDPDHLNRLLRLWKLLRPDEHLRGPVSKQWTDIGFQGDDPRTDFRGMGLLGLDNLVFFASEHTEVARHVLSHSQHPEYGYSFAIVGINLTSLLYHLLAKGKLKSHIFNAVAERPQVEDFHRAYSYVFFEFDKFWLAEKPTDIMEFNRIRDKFEDKLLQMLEKDDCVFKLNVAVKKV